MTDPATFAATAGLMRAEAELVEQIGRVIRDAESLEDAGAQLEAVASAKRIGAERLDEMAAGHGPMAHFNVAQFDDDGRQITDRCNCGNYVPCSEQS